MPKHKSFVDLTGMVFGRLTVIGYAGFKLSPKDKKEYYWSCVCECNNGRGVMVLGHLLKVGDTKSCGCIKHERVVKLFKTHGLSKTVEYGVWTDMTTRCSNKKHKVYKNYGGRGIKVCKRWRNSFEYFLEDMGKRPSEKHSLDRIDNNKGYFKENCRWATRSQQLRNTRRNVWLEYKGEKRILTDWAEELNISKYTIYTRIRKGETNPKIILRPVKKPS